MILPAITLYQPWATWIIRGWKTIETRTHNRFAGLKGKTILIHAGQKTDGSPAVVFNRYLTTEQLLHDPDEMINGFILGSAFVADSQSLNDDHAKAALIGCCPALNPRFGLFLTEIKKFENPIPVKGEMGIWYFDTDLMQKVKKASIEPLKLF